MEKVGMKLKPFSSLNQETVVISIKFFVLIFTIGAVFFQDLALIFKDALQTETTSYILALPFLIAYLVYRKRKMIRAVITVDDPDQPKKIKHLPTIIGILISITAMFAYGYGSYTFASLECHILALPIFASGLILILFNKQTLRQLAFPIAFLVLLTPPPAEILYTLGSTLSLIGSEVSYNIVRLVSIPATLISEYGSPVIQITRSAGTTINFAVDIACSGIYSLIGFLIFAVFIAYIMRDKTWKKLTLFVIGFPVIYILNIIRITTILLIGYHYGEEIALQLFHLLGGWALIFLGTFLLLIITEKLLRAQIFTKQPQKCPGCNPKPNLNYNSCLTCGRILKPASFRLPKTNIIKMATIIISAILLISIQAPVFALVEGPAQIMTQTSEGEQGNIQLLPQIEGYTLDFVYRDTNFEEAAGQDASLLYIYQPIDRTKEIVWVTIEIGPRSSLHSWESCIISHQLRIGRTPEGTQLDNKEIQIQENPPIIARYFAFQWVETNETQVVLYWFGTSYFKTNETTYEQNHLKISLITYPDTPQEITDVETLIPFAAAIASHWQPIKTLSAITVFLSQNGVHFAAITSASAIGIIIIYYLETRKQRKLNTNTYQKLSTPCKQIIDAVLETQKSTAATLHAIAGTYKNKTGKNIEKEELFQRISEVERIGVIKSYVTSNQDEPIQIWKAEIFS
ncbi:MAG: exosortase/archaeosortase family protein [Candidatus Bathyarchaeota archaeon]